MGRPLGPPSSDLILAFADRYAHPKTGHQYVAELTDLLRVTGHRHPSELTETDVLRWCAGIGRPIANNTIRNRLSRATTFLRWCVRQGEAEPAIVETLTDRDNPLRRISRLYGKVQAKNPARWLTHEEALGQLLATCPADGEIGLRDELITGAMRSLCFVPHPMGYTGFGWPDRWIGQSGSPSARVLRVGSIRETGPSTWRFQVVCHHPERDLVRV